MTRWIKTIVGIVFVAFGVLWILQGLNLLQGSFMSGQSMWLVFGIILGLLGAWLLLSLRAGRGRVDVP
jgi:lipopolysaccharide export LptBFGC system permease protein LptF